MISNNIRLPSTGSPGGGGRDGGGGGGSTGAAKRDWQLIVISIKTKNLLIVSFIGDKKTIKYSTKIKELIT